MVSGMELALHHPHHHTSIAITGLHIAPLPVCISSPTATIPAFPAPVPSSMGSPPGAELEGAACPHPSAGGVLSRWLFSPCQLLNSGNEKHIRAS